MQRRVFLNDNGKLLLSENVEVGDEYRSGKIAATEGYEIISVHNHLGGKIPGEGFSNGDLRNCIISSDFCTRGKIEVVVTEGGAFLAIYSPFRRLLEQIKVTKAYKKYYRFKNREVIREMNAIPDSQSLSNFELDYLERELKFEQANSEAAVKYGYKGIFNQAESIKFSNQFSNEKRLKLQADLAKALGIWIYFVPKGDDVARRIV
jgi:hypothetical protein